MDTMASFDLVVAYCTIGKWQQNSVYFYKLVLNIDIKLLILVQAKSLAERLQEVILSERKAIDEFTYTVSGVLSSSASSTSRSDNLQQLLGDNERCSVYRFKMRQDCVHLNL